MEPKIDDDTLSIPRGNGRGKVRLLSRKNLDGRTKAAKIFDRIADGIASDLGGADQLSMVETHLTAAFAGIAVHVNSLNAQLLLGAKVDLNEHATAVSTLVRIAAKIGTGRRPKDVTPSLKDYLERFDADQVTQDAS